MYTVPGIALGRSPSCRAPGGEDAVGHRYSQAAHALNAIAYYLRVTDMDSPDAMERPSRAEGALLGMQPGRSLQVVLESRNH